MKALALLILFLLQRPPGAVSATDASKQVNCHYWSEDGKNIVNDLFTAQFPMKPEEFRVAINKEIPENTNTEVWIGAKTRIGNEQRIAYSWNKYDRTGKNNEKIYEAPDFAILANDVSPRPHNSYPRPRDTEGSARYFRPLSYKQRRRLLDIANHCIPRTVNPSANWLASYLCYAVCLHRVAVKGPSAYSSPYKECAPVHPTFAN
eukprot:GHVU01231610.1.p1 GENE.GHVU01231610.1~~GHVU01231610.1.p1  ORF type:complete len:205 (+),score=4.22 GHVU01231610.1:1701-2315(+)